MNSLKKYEGYYQIYRMFFERKGLMSVNGIHIYWDSNRQCLSYNEYWRIRNNNRIESHTTKGRLNFVNDIYINLISDDNSSIEYTLLQHKKDDTKIICGIYKRSVSFKAHDGVFNYVTPTAFMPIDFIGVEAKSFPENFTSFLNKDEIMFQSIANEMAKFDLKSMMSSIDENREDFIWLSPHPN